MVNGEWSIEITNIHFSPAIFSEKFPRNPNMYACAQQGQLSASKTCKWNFKIGFNTQVADLTQRTGDATRQMHDGKIMTRTLIVIFVVPGIGA